MDRKRSQFQIELALHQGYSILLTFELRVARLPVLAAPQIPSQGPIIPPFELMFMPVPLGPLGGWGSFAQAPGSSQGLGYTLGTSGSAGPSTNPFVGSDDNDGANTIQTSLLVVMILSKVSLLM
nr:hypothetical protein CFP56_46138 [Quercus suber]